MKSLIRRILLSFGYAIHDAEWIDYLKRYKSPWMPPGHFYSPYPDLDEIRANEERIFYRDKPVLGIDLREKGQFETLTKIGRIYPSICFPETKTPEFRYYFDNPAYAYSDGIVLHAMLRIIKPRRVIEVGSGYSSAMMLDTNELFFQNRIELTCIDPYPDLLHSLMRPQDEDCIVIVPSKLQELDPCFFEKLGENDILFIDSTHVSKVNSDVNFIFFEILPRLQKGVHIHFHDLQYPFEYLKEWVYEGRAWHETYLLRAFLMDNPRYSIEYFQHFMFYRHHDFFQTHLPLCLKNYGGCFWLKKVY